MKEKLIAEMKRLIDRQDIYTENQFADRVKYISASIPAGRDIAVGVLAAVERHGYRRPEPEFELIYKELSKQNNFIIVSSDPLISSEDHRFKISGAYQERFEALEGADLITHPIKGIGCNNTPCITVKLKDGIAELSATCSHHSARTPAGPMILIDLNQAKKEAQNPNKEKS